MSKICVNKVFMLLLCVQMSDLVQMDVRPSVPEFQEFHDLENRGRIMHDHSPHFIPQPPSKPPKPPPDPHFIDLQPSSGSHHGHPVHPFHPVHPVHHAGLPRNVGVIPLELREGDHELMFNVTWTPPTDGFATDYSIEVTTVTESKECDTQMCYEYNIPGDTSWWVIPSQLNTVAGSCSIRPGCSYSVKLIPHPWDGRTAANVNVELDDCVANVCSCSYASQLPVPEVTARTVSVRGEIMANITWTLPPLGEVTVPAGLEKKGYLVSIGKQMVTDAHPVPWFSFSSNHKIDTNGPISSGDVERTALIPVSERGHGGPNNRNLVLDVKLVARVRLLDSRDCVGPSGNSTAYDPAEAKKSLSSSYAVWAAFGVFSILIMVLIIMIGSRGIKKVLNVFRSTAETAPLEPLRNPPIWLPLQIRTFDS